MSTDIEVNDSPYPDSVKAGIPKLSPTPKGWEKAPLKKYLYEVRRPAKLENDKLYKLVTVKRSRGGAEEREWLTGKQIKTKTQFFVEEGDFLISKRQIVHGACAVVPKELHGAVVSNEYCILHSNGGIDIGFLNYLSHTLYFQQTCFHSSIGVHVEKMIFRQNKWLDWEFNIPPIEEQVQIVRILDAIGVLISSLEKIIKSKNEEKLALMQHLLTGKRRFSKFSSQVWTQSQLGEIGACIRGISYKPYDIIKGDSGGIKLLRANNIQRNRISLEDVTRVTESLVSAEKKLKDGDVVICMANGSRHLVGKAAYIDKACGSSTIGAFCSLYRLIADKVDSKFVGQFFNSPIYDYALRSRFSGSSINNLKPSDIEEIPINLPPLAEQRRISAVLSAADREMDQLTQKLDAYKQQKKGLMQQLLTGKKRVKLDHKEVA